MTSNGISGLATRTDRGACLVDGAYPLTAEDFQRIAAMARADAGIALPDTKATLVYSRLVKRRRALGLESFRDYCALVAAGDGVEERRRMLAALPTNVTRFFREPHHFEHLASTVLPPLIEYARAGGRMRLWSAACSSGQEPYSMALTLLSLWPEAARYDVRILATDIDPNVVAAGREGVYSAELLAGTTTEHVRRWFRPLAAETFEVGDALREIVAFRELNLHGSWPMKGRFDAIFCRNVAIYFEEETQSRVWSRFAPVLNPGGRLFIGHSERLTGPAAALFVSEGVTTYRVKDGAPA